MVISLSSPVGRIASNLNSAHLVHILKSNVYLVSQVQGVFFEDVTVGIDSNPWWRWWRLLFGKRRPHQVGSGFRAGRKVLDFKTRVF